MNALLDAEAVWLRNAQRYERSEARRDTRVGYYQRKLQTKRLARQGAAEDMEAPAADRANARGYQPLEVDGASGQIGLASHVPKAALDTARKPVAVTCVDLEAFRPPVA